MRSTKTSRGGLHRTKHRGRTGIRQDASRPMTTDVSAPAHTSRDNTANRSNRSAKKGATRLHPPSSRVHYRAKEHTQRTERTRPARDRVSRQTLPFIDSFCESLFHRRAIAVLLAVATIALAMVALHGTSSAMVLFVWHFTLCYWAFLLALMLANRTEVEPDGPFRIVLTVSVALLILACVALFFRSFVIWIAFEALWRFRRKFKNPPRKSTANRTKLRRGI